MPKWTPEARFRLLLAIITVNNVTTPDWNKVAVMMGDDYTVEAVKQAYKKIRNEVSAELNVDALGGPVTPKKSAPRGGKRKQEEDGNDDEGEAGKAKSAKKGKKATAEPKEEIDGEERIKVEE